MISIIVARAENLVIADKDGKLPWYLPKDLKRFKELTTGHTVVMGINTLKSLPGGKPLPNRRNIILTHQNIIIPDAEVVHSTDDLYKILNPDEEIFIIGGESVYRQFIGIADKIYLTDVKRKFDGRACFPSFPERDYILTKLELVDDDSVDFKYYFKEFQKVQH